MANTYTQIHIQTVFSVQDRFCPARAGLQPVCNSIELKIVAGNNGFCCFRLGMD